MTADGVAAAAFAGTALICGGEDPGRRNITNPLIAALDGGGGLPWLDTVANRPGPQGLPARGSEAARQ
jgi:hypothetical protein